MGEVCFVTDIDVENHENVLAYLKVLQRIGRVKGYSPSGYDCFNGRNSFCLDGNSNGIEFMIYDLAEVLGECIGKNDKGRKKAEAMIRRAKGMNPKTLQKLLGHSSLQMTMDLYCHVLDETLKEEMSNIAEMV